MSMHLIQAPASPNIEFYTKKFSIEETTKKVNEYILPQRSYTISNSL